MSKPRRGARIRLSPARKIAIELLEHARRIPSLPLSREMNLKETFTARAQTKPELSWVAIFLRAYALVAQDRPELRRAFIPWPYPHLYEHPISEAAILVERDWEGENVVLGAKVRSPESTALAELQQQLVHFKQAPVWEVNYYRQALRVGALPSWLRRFTFWQSLYLSGYKRAKRFGTFMISSLGSLGVEQMHPLTPLTTYLTFGPIAADGHVTVKIIYDHRVLDGRTVARALSDLETVLRGRIVEELLGQRSAAA